MAQENIEVVRSAIEAFGQRDLDTVVQFYDPGVVLHWTRSPGRGGGPLPRARRSPETHRQLLRRAGPAPLTFSA